MQYIVQLYISCDRLMELKILFYILLQWKMNAVLFLHNHD